MPSLRPCGGSEAPAHGEAIPCADGPSPGSPLHQAPNRRGGRTCPQGSNRCPKHGPFQGTGHGLATFPVRARTQCPRYRLRRNGPPAPSTRQREGVRVRASIPLPCPFRRCDERRGGVPAAGLHRLHGRSGSGIPVETPRHPLVRRNHGTGTVRPLRRSCVPARQRICQYRHSSGKARPTRHSLCVSPIRQEGALEGSRSCSICS